MGGFVANVADVQTAELEEFGTGAFLALEEVLFVGFEFGDVEDGIEGCFHGLLWFGSDHGVLFEDHFFCGFCFSVEQDYTPFIDDFSEVEIMDGLGWVQDGLFEVGPVESTKGQDENEGKYDNFLHWGEVVYLLKYN